MKEDPACVKRTFGSKGLSFSSKIPLANLAKKASSWLIMSELDPENKGPFYYWYNKDLRGKSLDFDQKWWLGTQLTKNLASVDMLIEIYQS